MGCRGSRQGYSSDNGETGGAPTETYEIEKRKSSKKPGETSKSSKALPIGFLRVSCKDVPPLADHPKIYPVYFLEVKADGDGDNWTRLERSLYGPESTQSTKRDLHYYSKPDPKVQLRISVYRFPIHRSNESKDELKVLRKDLLGYALFWPKDLMTTVDDDDDRFYAEQELKLDHYDDARRLMLDQSGARLVVKASKGKLAKPKGSSSGKSSSRGDQNGHRKRSEHKRSETDRSTTLGVEKSKRKPATPSRAASSSTTSTATTRRGSGSEAAEEEYE